MLKINISKQSAKFLKKFPPKHSLQLALKIRALQMNPYPQDSKILQGKLGQYLRTDSGEYRIIYEVLSCTLYIILIGKRNDDEVYRQIKRRI